MKIKELKLINFRNFIDKRIEINPYLTLIVGKNSLGKTNLLEGIYFLINGVGFRESKEEELIDFGGKETFVEGTMELNDKDLLSFSIKLFLRNGITNKKFFINKTEKGHGQYSREQVKSILFSPEQINIIIGPPQLRRDYLNKTISFFDQEYKKKLTNYEAALKKRNKILELKITKEKLEEELEFWNDYLIKQAEYITKTRQFYLDFLNKNKTLDSKQFSTVYVKSEFNKERLKDKFLDEIRFRRTLIGPQKDDFQIFVDSNKNNKNVHSFGSRSEQRLAIFWLKINEIKYFENFFKKKPIMLLDDIFSELDKHNQKIIVNLIKNYQTIATTTEEELVKIVNLPKTIVRL